MNRLDRIEKDIKSLKSRNMRVENDKAWETSFARRVLVAVLTYIVIVVFFFSAGIQNPAINAIVPALAFLLSTLSLPIFKNLWLRGK
jgi:preprotein translocase subunit SecF